MFRKLSLKKGIIDFASNDYLGMSRCPKLKQDIFKEFQTLEQIGSSGSRLLTGNSLYAETIENSIARHYGEESGLLFTSGYLANLSLFSIITREDVILFDKDVHASLRDGITLSRAKHYAWQHNDLNHLENLLKKQTKRVFVCVESLYSVDGSFAPLNALTSICERYQASLMVDEAHSTGVFGFTYKAFARVLTFGKAWGIQGAIVIGNQKWHHFLVNKARSFIYTTAPSYVHLAMIKCAFSHIRESEQRNRLFHLMEYFKSPSPIISVKVKDGLTMTKKLEKYGIEVSLLRYPTVKQGEERLRITLHSYNTEKEIDLLKEILCDQL